MPESGQPRNTWVVTLSQVESIKAISNGRSDVAYLRGKVNAADVFAA